MHIALRVLLLLTLAFPTLAAEDVQVMIVGTFHFDDPGLDYVKSSVPDVLSETRQKEIAGIIDNLARFRPTKVMVEALTAKGDGINREYSEYREGKRALTRNEIDQLGYRLAKKMNLPAIQAIDVKVEMDLGGVMAEAQKNDPKFMALFSDFMKNVLEPQNKSQVEKPLRDTLRTINDPKNIELGHRMYVAMAPLGSGENPIGAEQTAIWYERNIKIFANLARAAKPGDRIVVFYGGGHTAILQQLVRSMPGMKLVEANDFL